LIALKGIEGTSVPDKEQRYGVLIPRLLPGLACSIESQLCAGVNIPARELKPATDLV
jgi:hypothetical protein